jgi:DNA polymerase IV
LHVDMDAFYAAVEVRDNPALRGLPVIIAHTGPRGVVSTASYEARTFGVRSAMPTARAQRLCPQGVVIEPRIAHYAKVSKQIFAVFAQTTPEIEGLSLDEAFLDVTASLSLFHSGENIAQFIRAEVLGQTGLTCSVGLAHNKLLAKMASEFCKPNGYLHLRPELVHATLDPLPVGKLYTIGKVAVEKLAAVGIHSIGALRAAPAALVRRALGNHSEQAQAFAAGIDERPVQPEREEKSLGAETTFATDLTDLDAVRRVLMRLSEKLCSRLRAQQLQAHTLTLKLRVPPFETCTRQAPLVPAGNSTAAVYHLGEALLQRWWSAQKRPQLRLLGLTASNVRPLQSAGDVAQLVERPPVQADLFALANESTGKVFASANEATGKLFASANESTGKSSSAPSAAQSLVLADQSPPDCSPSAAPGGLTVAKRDALHDAINQKFGPNSLRRARGLDTV